MVSLTNRSVKRVCKCFIEEISINIDSFGLSQRRSFEQHEKCVKIRVTYQSIYFIFRLAFVSALQKPDWNSCGENLDWKINVRFFLKQKTITPFNKNSSS